MFAKYEDPFVLNKEAEKLLQEIDEIKSTEDNYYRALRAAKKDKKETPTFMDIIDRHTDGLTKNLRAFREVYEEHEKALKDRVNKIVILLNTPLPFFTFQSQNLCKIGIKAKKANVTTMHQFRNYF